jgi:Tol biopolymer transport system component
MSAVMLALLLTDAAFAGTDVSADADVAAAVRPSGRLLYERGNGVWAAEAATGAGRRLPALAGGVQAAWSPDGLRITFVKDVRGTPVVFVAAADGRRATKLTSLPPPSERYPQNGDFSPSWFPDSRRILFQREITDTVGDDDFVDLFVAGGGARGARRLTRSPYLWEHEPDLSPDGRAIVLSLFDPAGTDLGGLALARSDGRGLRWLTRSETVEDHQPRWSPDGTRIAFTRLRYVDGEAFNEVYVVLRDGSGLRRLTSRTRAVSPVWSPDGRLVAYCEFDGPQGRKLPQPRQLVVPSAGGPAQALPLRPAGCATDWAPGPKL